MESGSRRVVIAGLAANLLILISKTTAAFITGSSSMLAECFHSAVDTGNTALLLLGEHRSRKPADDLHPFGRGKELYFWSFVVAVSMFGIGGGMSVYEGIMHLKHPEPITSPVWAYAVLSISAVFSSISFVIALREANSQKGNHTLLQYIRRSKDPTVFTVLLEDLGDIVGELTALLAVYLTSRLGIHFFDGAGSILIGFAMIAISWVLANESRALLIGESADPDAVQSIKKLVVADPAVERVGKLLTMQLGPEQVLLNVEVDFHSQGSLEALEQAIERISRNIQREHPSVQHVYLEATSLQKPALAEKKPS